MKKVYAMILLISLLLVPYTYAQMDKGMMEGQGNQEQMGSGMMDSKQGRMKGMDGHEVKGAIMHNMGQMSRLMQQMREMIAKKPDAESMSNMSDIMLNMSEHIEEMSKIMKKGNASEKEMQEMDEHNLKMQKSYDMLRW